MQQRMSHVLYERVMCHMNKPYLIWTSLLQHFCTMSQWTSFFFPPHTVHCMYTWTEWRRIWTSHVSCEWGVSHMNESYSIGMSHIPYEWVIFHMTEACLTWMCHLTLLVSNHGAQHAQSMANLPQRRSSCEHEGWRYWARARCHVRWAIWASTTPDWGKQSRCWIGRR